MENTKNIDRILYYQRKYGKRRGESWGDWILKKRSINTAVHIISEISGIGFEELEQGLYFRCDEQLRIFQRRYESQMEEAYLRPDEFVKNIDAFYSNVCSYIEENQLFREFFRFTEMLTFQRRRKVGENRRYDAVYNAYISLLMQQVMYFSRDRLAYSVIGISEKGELLYALNPNPYIDVGIYELEKKMAKLTSGKIELAEREILDAYRAYSYDFQSLEEAYTCEAMTRIFDNNLYNMIPYTSERTLDILIQEPYCHYVPVFPRVWQDTEVYRRRLQHRNYMLPATGITAEFINAGDIKEIRFAEELHNGEMVLLYRVITDGNGEYSGYYRTKCGLFYSIYEYSNHTEWHERIENFILENYMILTCTYEITRKKNFAIRQVDSFEREFHYPYQPLAIYNYKGTAEHKKGTGSARKYIKENYMEEIRTKNGYIRRLPSGQNASEGAIQSASEIGIELPAGMTYVRSHEYTTHLKIFRHAEK